MQLWLIPALPLAGFVINGAFGRRFSKAIINVVAIGSVLLAFAWALKTCVPESVTMPKRDVVLTPGCTYQPRV